jgi:type IV/VI secretion system ImpK/VasF family protein
MDQTRVYRRSELVRELPPLFSAAASPLLHCYGPLIYLGMRLRAGEQPTDSPALFQQRALKQLSEARERAKPLGCSREHIDAAEMAVIALLDTAVFELSGPFRDHWTRRSLELDRHGSQVAGHRFFSLLHALRQEGTPQARQALEVFYFCLLAGFEGEYRSRRGALERLLQELRLELAPRGGPAPLAPSTRVELPPPPAPPRAPPGRPLLVAAAGFVLLMTALTLVYLRLQSGALGDEMAALAGDYSELRPRAGAQAPAPPAPPPEVTPDDPPAAPVDPPGGQPPPAQPAGIPLTLTSQPSGATVYINGARVGVTPLEGYRLPREAWYEVVMTLGDQRFSQQLPVNAARTNACHWVVGNASCGQGQ